MIAPTIDQFKPSEGWIGIDLDGTLAQYDKWKGPDYIGAPIPKMVHFVRDLLAKGIEVRIMTARVGPQKDPQEIEPAIKAIKAWCQQHLGRELAVTNEKDFSMVWLYDDRCTRVQKNHGFWYDPGHASEDPPLAPDGGFDPSI